MGPSTVEHLDSSGDGDKYDPYTGMGHDNDIAVAVEDDRIDT